MTWFIHITTKKSQMWHDSFIHVTWLIRMCVPSKSSRKSARCSVYYITLPWRRFLRIFTWLLMNLNSASRNIKFEVEILKSLPAAKCTIWDDDRALLRKMTYKDEGSYDSKPTCTMYNNNLVDFWEILWDAPRDTTHSYMWHDSFVCVYRVKILGSPPAARFTK